MTSAIADTAAVEPTRAGENAAGRGAPLVAEQWPEHAVPPLNVRWWMLVGVWLIPATIAALQSMAGYILRDSLAREWPWVWMQYPRWLVWAGFTPLIFWMCDRVPLARGRFGRAVLLHLLFSLTLAFVYEIAWYQVTLALEHYLHPEAPRVGVRIAGLTTTPLALQFSVIILPRLVSDVVTYAAVLGLATTIGYQRRLRERDVSAAQLEAQLATAQVQALKMQVHPHFLFNTLHAVNVLIREQPAAAERMVTQLGDLLRLTLSRASTAEVSFRNELEILQLYLEIEQTRFRDRLHVDYFIAGDTRDALVPDLILQPLVENAIKHGVNKTSGAARIEVHACRSSGQLILEIQDNGRGLPDGAVIEEGIGLTTTRARLQHLYGQKQTLTLERASGGGCRARVTLPFRTSAALHA